MPQIANYPKPNPIDMTEADIMAEIKAYRAEKRAGQIAN